MLDLYLRGVLLLLCGGVVVWVYTGFEWRTLSALLAVAVLWPLIPVVLLVIYWNLEL